MKPNETIYAGDAQFVGWSDSHTGGPIIKLRLPSSDDLDKFRALTIGKGAQAGHLFSIAIVEHDGAGNMTPPPEGTKASPGTERKHRFPGPLCIEAAGYCRNEQFQHWVIMEGYDEDRLKTDPVIHALSDEELAKQFILDTCGVSSRKELDTVPEAGLSFVNLIRIPFIHWERARREGEVDG